MGGRRRLAVEGSGRAIVDEVDAAFRRGWSERGVSPVRRAPELAILRRLSRGLTGTVPSLEKVSRFEARPQTRRLAAWLDETCDDRCHADYFAKRLARPYVGTEGAVSRLPLPAGRRRKTPSIRGHTRDRSIKGSSR